MRFVKMHGIGNDYVYINGFAHRVEDPQRLAPIISDRHTGVGGDGLILVTPPDSGTGAHVRMRMFNSDGSESEMCGNGIRCVCKLAHDHNICRENPMRVQTGNGVLTLRYTVGNDGMVEQVTVNMGQPILRPSDIPVNLPELEQVVDFPAEDLVPWDALGPAGWTRSAGLDARMTCVSMGNPHVTFYVKDVAAVPLETIGPAIEHHPLFPRRINMHVVQIHSEGELTMRTWERGSGITMACGTGASAVCVSGVLTGRSARRVLAHLPGGDLTLEWHASDGHVDMTGPATQVFEGDWPET